MPDGWQTIEAGEESIHRVGRLVASLSGELGSAAAELLQRHGYRVEADGGGPHRNVLGHPLFELPIWLDGATAGEGRLGREVLLGICESSLCGYLSVRAEDDHFDGEWRDAAAAMTVSGFFRARHQALLAPLVSDRRFWERFEAVWQHYGEAMLLERALHDPARKFGRPEFDAVLDRSQPLEIPGDTVLAIKGCWELGADLAAIVRHLAKATQLFDDFVDAPADLAAGNFTWMVRRLGGLCGERTLRSEMVGEFDKMHAEVEEELDRAVTIAGSIGMVGMTPWVEERRRVIARASERMYSTLFDRLASRRGQELPAPRVSQSL